MRAWGEVCVEIIVENEYEEKSEKKEKEKHRAGCIQKWKRILDNSNAVLAMGA
jgi:hypothetical protein